MCVQNMHRSIIHSLLFSCSRQRPLRIGFIGGGQMATALSMGMVKGNVLPPNSSIIVSDPYQSQLVKVRNAFNAINPTHISLQTTQSNKECIATKCDIVFIAIKPQYFESLKPENMEFFGNELIVSMMAGISLDALQSAFGDKQRIVRIMPNTPALIGCAAICYTQGPFASNEDMQLIEHLLNYENNLILRVNSESLIDAMTGVSGSGPAFVFLMIEALADGGVLAGLSRSDSLQLAAQTVLGAASMVIQTKKHPGALKDAVASPAGTTIAGIQKLEENKFRYAIISAVEAAAKRAKELGQLKMTKNSKL